MLWIFMQPRKCVGVARPTERLSEFRLEAEELRNRSGGAEREATIQRVIVRATRNPLSLDRTKAGTPAR